MIQTIPLGPIYEVGLTEIVDKDDQVDQNDFSATVDLTVGIGTLPTSGEILSIVLVSSELGSGGVQEPSGELLFFDADPNTTAGDTALTTAEWKTLIGKVSISDSDWISDANGAVYFDDVAIPFHEVSTIYVVWLHTYATSYNDAAGDDEELHLNLWYRRDS
jgi:hypothetical protein